MNKQKGEGEIGMLIVVVGIALIIISIFWMWPRYNLYRARISGQAQLAESISSKQVMVQDALAKKESAQSLAEAEVIRAGGVARANLIIGNSLKNNEAYLRYLFVNNLQDTKDQIIYVPTEAQLPILEATRSQRPAPAGSN
jgi:hypothetical protein